MRSVCSAGIIGYLWLGARLDGDKALRSGWNFGPDEGRAYTVAEVVGGLLDRFSPSQTRLVVEPDVSGTEALLLQLDCAKAREQLKWRPTYDLGRTLDAIVEWYCAASAGEADMYAFTAEQIRQYSAEAHRQGAAWAAHSDSAP